MNCIDAGVLRLVPQTAAHAAEMFVILSDPALYRFENSPPPSIDWLHDRFLRLETRRSPDRAEQWLNWVIRVPTGELIGYVQATVMPAGRAAIAYVLSSQYWGRGLACRAVAAMMSELHAHYGVRSFSAVLKRENLRSLRLLERLEFVPAPAAMAAAINVESGEILMHHDAHL